MIRIQIVTPREIRSKEIVRREMKSFFGNRWEVVRWRLAQTKCFDRIQFSQTDDNRCVLSDLLVVQEERVQTIARQIYTNKPHPSRFESMVNKKYLKNRTVTIRLVDRSVCRRKGTRRSIVSDEVANERKWLISMFAENRCVNNETPTDSDVR